jgi:hypothetical protein
MNPLEQLLQFIFSLQEAKVQFRLDCVRDAIMVVVPTPSSYYEVEFFGDGRIESQTFGPSSEVRRFRLKKITQEVIQAVNGQDKAD